MLRWAGDRWIYQGTLLSATEKDALDIWYVRNASLRFDLRIIGMTLLGWVKSDWRGEDALAQAVKLRYQEPDPSEVLSTWPITATLRTQMRLSSRRLEPNRSAIK